MDGYTIWLAPIAGILIADYWIVHNQVLSVPDMYRPHGIYAYNKWGTNWRAAVAFLVGFAPLLPGFAASVSGYYFIQVKEKAGVLTYYVKGEFKCKSGPGSNTLLLFRIFLGFLCWRGTACSFKQDFPSTGNNAAQAASSHGERSLVLYRDIRMTEMDSLRSHLGHWSPWSRGTFLR
jgi:hypothetical protein